MAAWLTHGYAVVRMHLPSNVGPEATQGIHVVGRRMASMHSMARLCGGREMGRLGAVLSARQCSECPSGTAHVRCRPKRAVCGSMAWTRLRRCPHALAHQCWPRCCAGHPRDVEAHSVCAQHGVAMWREGKG
jgi:hypothetical protein